MDIIINRDVGYCGVLPDRRCVVKENGDVLMLNSDGSWRLLKDGERSVRLNKMNINLGDCTREIKRSKRQDRINHRSTDRVRGMLRNDTVKLDDKNCLVRTVNL